MGGTVSLITFDKTGTLTEEGMKLKSILACNDSTFKIEHVIDLNATSSEINLEKV